MVMTGEQYLFITEQTNVGHYENHLERLIEETGLSQREIARYVDMAPGTHLLMCLLEVQYPDIQVAGTTILHTKI
jgi:hypothetical protein